MPVHIGTIFRKIRLDLKLSQAEVGRRAGLKREYLNRIEAGHIQPTIITLNKVAKGLGVPLSEIVLLWEDANGK